MHSFAKFKIVQGFVSQCSLLGQANVWIGYQ